MSRVATYRVLELPGVTKPNAIYYVKGPGSNAVKQFVTDKDGNAFPVIDDTDAANIDLGTF